MYVTMQPHLEYQQMLIFYHTWVFSIRYTRSQ